MRYGYVATNLLDLWAEPRFNSERASQLLYCEPLTIHDEQQGYLQVKQIDGYMGWVDTRQIIQIDEPAYKEYLSSKLHSVKTSQTAVFDKQRRHVIPHQLYYGSLVRVVRRSGVFAEIRLPDNQRRMVRANAIAAIPTRKKSTVTCSMLVSDARRFLGVPYLWGGVTPCGFDCSGLVQTVCRRFGIVVPRDTKDQITVGRVVPRKDVKTGDLLFFKRHVGIAVGKDRIIHCSIGGSGVRINSLRPGLPDYREDLDRDFAQARRIV